MSTIFRVRSAADAEPTTDRSSRTNIGFINFIAGRRHRLTLNLKHHKPPLRITHHASRILLQTPIMPYHLSMKYRRFGRTELQMPVFSCGGMRYQFKWQDVPPQDIPAENQDNVEAVIHRALELGINHIETARGYGSSEMQLGRILPTLPRDKMIVQTKVPPTANSREFLQTFDSSMKYLGLDYVDLLALHGI